MLLIVCIGIVISSILSNIDGIIHLLSTKHEIITQYPIQNQYDIIIIGAGPAGLTSIPFTINIPK